MADAVRFFRVKALPEPTEPDAIYYVKPDGEDSIRQFVTDNDGNAFAMRQDADLGNVDLGQF